MNIDPKLSVFFSGESFSNGLNFDLSKMERRVVNTSELLSEWSRDKKVIHVGCADHVPLIKSKIDQGTWLHNKLIESASRCVGIDVDKSSIQYLENELKINDLICLDIVKDELPDTITQDDWDYLILGDVIEHVDNPIDFLDNVCRKFRSYCRELVITTPNALRLRNSIDSIRHRETINSDHRCWYSPYTLAKISNMAGLEPTMIFLAERGRLKRRRILTKAILSQFPLLRDTLVLRARIHQSAG